jgi:hypothetical protein
MKIRLLGAQFFYADRRTDGSTDGHDIFHNYANAPKNR